MSLMGQLALLVELGYRTGVKYYGIEDGIYQMAGYGQ